MTTALLIIGACVVYGAIALHMWRVLDSADSSPPDDPATFMDRDPYLEPEVAADNRILNVIFAVFWPLTFIAMLWGSVAEQMRK